MSCGTFEVNNIKRQHPDADKQDPKQLILALYYLSSIITGQVSVYNLLIQFIGIPILCA